MSAPNPVVVERVIDAPAEAIFELLATPSRHADIDGSGQLKGDVRGPERLSLGTAFSMGMQQARLPYRTRNAVVEFEEGTRIAWATEGRIKGRRVVGGQIWRFVLAPHEGSTLVRHEYDWRAASVGPLLGLLGYPKRAAEGMAGTLQALELAVTDPHLEGN